MDPDRQHPSTTTTAKRCSAPGLLIALCSIPPLLAPSTMAIACSDRLVCSRQDIAALQAFPQPEPRSEARRLTILSINAPDRDGEIGTIVFGGGESLHTPSALRGPR